MIIVRIKEDVCILSNAWHVVSSQKRLANGGYVGCFAQRREGIFCLLITKAQV